MEESGGIKLIAGDISTYKTDGKGLIDKQYKLNTLSPVPLSSFKFSNQLSGQVPVDSIHGIYEIDPRYEEESSVQQYDDAGNPLLIVNRDSILTSYAWSYNKQYPIAQVRNALPEEFFYTGFEESGASGSAHSGRRLFAGTFTTSDKVLLGLNGKTYVISYWYFNNDEWHFSGELAYTGQVLNGTLDDIRIYPVEAQMTTYTYEPLVGMTSETDASGRTIYYEYDSFQRLKHLKDQNGKILKSYDYHYKDQPQP